MINFFQKNYWLNSIILINLYLGFMLHNMCFGIIISLFFASFQYWFFKKDLYKSREELRLNKHEALVSELRTIIFKSSGNKKLMFLISFTIINSAFLLGKILYKLL